MQNPFYNRGKRVKRVIAFSVEECQLMNTEGITELENHHCETSNIVTDLGKDGS